MRGSSQRGGMHPSSRRLGLFRGIHSCAENGPIMCFIVHSHKKGVIKESVFIHSAALCLRMMSSLLERSSLHYSLVNLQNLRFTICRQQALHLCLWLIEVSVFSWTALPSGANRPLTCIPFQLPCLSFAVFNKWPECFYSLLCFEHCTSFTVIWVSRYLHAAPYILLVPPFPLPTLAWVYKGRACELCLLWHVLQRPVWR